ncbi:MAG: hypothetical protein M1814_003571 [Vezdaea aestivalis]|nr:MAG: hypothetical protein M1814_003571 [Vezdaea aestivalis]
MVVDSGLNHACSPSIAQYDGPSLAPFSHSRPSSKNGLSSPLSPLTTSSNVPPDSPFPPMSAGASSTRGTGPWAHPPPLDNRTSNSSLESLISPSNASFSSKVSKPSKLRLQTNQATYPAASRHSKGSVNDLPSTDSISPLKLQQGRTWPTPVHSTPTSPYRSRGTNFNDPRAPPYFQSSYGRDRSCSVSSRTSPDGSALASPRPSTSSTDLPLTAYPPPRQRYFPPNPTSYRPDRPPYWQHFSNPQRRQDLPFAPPDGFSNDEVRGSFRSALTATSSYAGTSATERSSVATKASSISDFHAGGPNVSDDKIETSSIDDVLGLYADGFEDSGTESEFEGPRSRYEGAESKDGGSASIDDHNGPSKPPSSPLKPKSRPDSLNQDGLSDRPFPQRSITHTHNQSTSSSPLFDLAPSGAAIQSAPPSPPPTSHSAHILSKPSDSIKAPHSNDDAFRALTTNSESRDRYGFRKASQHVTLEQFENWSDSYEPYLARRRRKWEEFMAASGLDTRDPEFFPQRTAKLKRFVRKGIPPAWRGQAWFTFAGGHRFRDLKPALYRTLLAKVEAGDLNSIDHDAIERDLHRTFPDNSHFKPESASADVTPPDTPILCSLRRVLQAFALHAPKIGYCQSLNFLAGLMLLMLRGDSAAEEKAFVLLHILTSTLLPGMHSVTLEGANSDMSVLMSLLKDELPTVYTRLVGDWKPPTSASAPLRPPPITLCITPWFMTIFLSALPIEPCLRIWDVLFLEGPKTLFRISLTLFKLGEPRLRALRGADEMEVFQFVQGLPRGVLDANALLAACYKRRGGFTGVRGEVVRRRREEAKAALEREREGIRKSRLEANPGKVGSWRKLKGG